MLWLCEFYQFQLTIRPKKYIFVHDCTSLVQEIRSLKKELLPIRFDSTVTAHLTHLATSFSLSVYIHLGGINFLIKCWTKNHPSIDLLSWSSLIVLERYLFLIAEHLCYILDNKAKCQDTSNFSILNISWYDGTLWEESIKRYNRISQYNNYVVSKWLVSIKCLIMYG